jgi:hypothetical protein
MVAARADVEIVGPLLDEHHLLAFAAFVPEVVGALPLRQRLDSVTDSVQPTHRKSLVIASGELGLRPGDVY